MGMDTIGEVGDRASEGQAIGVYGTDFIVGSLGRVGAREWGCYGWEVGRGYQDGRTWLRKTWLYPTREYGDSLWYCHSRA